MIFISGSSGLIGSFIAKKFLQEGFQVKAIKRSNTDLSLLGNYADKIEWQEGDITDPTFLTEAMNGIETVIHSAAIVSYSPKDRDQIYKINVEGTANMINAAIANGVKNFCHISSVSALGKNIKKPLVTEADPFLESAYNSNYGKSKFLAELEVFRGMEEGLNVFMVNPSVVLGPGAWNKGSSSIFKYVFDQKPFYTRGKLNYIDVRDVADIVFQLNQSQKDINGQKFILNAGTVSYRDLFQMVADLFNVRAPHIEAKPFMAELAWRVEYLKSLVSSHKPMITKETVKLSKSQFSYENRKITELLDYKFRNLDQTLNWTCQEFVKKYNLKLINK